MVTETDSEISSDLTQITARSDGTGWVVDQLPNQILTYSQAYAAVCIGDALHGRDPFKLGYVHVWATNLGVPDRYAKTLFGPAIGAAS